MAASTTLLSGRSHDDEHPATIARVGSAGHELAGNQSVDAIGHRATRNEGLLQKCLRAQLVRIARAPQRREHVEFPRFEVGCRKRGPPRPIQVSRQPADARQHLQRSEVEVGAFGATIDDAVYFVVDPLADRIVAPAPRLAGEPES